MCADGETRLYNALEWETPPLLLGRAAVRREEKGREEMALLLGRAAVRREEKRREEMALLLGRAAVRTRHFLDTS